MAVGAPDLPGAKERQTAPGIRLRPGETGCSGPATTSAGRGREGCWPGRAERVQLWAHPGSSAVRQPSTAGGCRAIAPGAVPGTAGNGAAGTGRESAAPYTGTRLGAPARVAGPGGSAAADA